MGATILIVDDDPRNRTLLAAMLGGEGYSTVQAGDGLEALDALERENIDVVISDVLMPNMDGYSLCAAVRGCDRLHDMPFVFYTGTYTQSSDEKLALDFGANRFLRKPARVAVFTKVIDELITEKQSSESKAAPATEALAVMKQYSQALIAKLEKRNTELSERTTALHASKTRLQTIFEAQPDCVLVAGSDGIVSEMNRAGLDIFESDSLESVASRSLISFVVEEGRPAFGACVEAAWRGEKHCAEFEVTGLRGTRRWLEMHSAPLFDQQGRIVALLGIARDNTARKALEEQFVQAQKMEVVGQLAGGVAHDFNNMLGIIMGCSELVMDELSSGSSLHENVQTIFHTAERAAALTRQLLIFSRKQKPKPQVLDLSETISAIDPMLRRLIGDNIKLATVPRMDLGRIEADPGQIEQVLLNLTVNARDAMPNGGTITITTSNATILEGHTANPQLSPGEYVVLSVADTGIGMSEQVKAKIFEPFFSTKPAGQGTGLGLATCHAIISQWRGHITAESTVAIGTTFNVYLPRVTERADAARASGRAGRLPRGTETILVVEDEPGLRDLAAIILQQLGYTVIKASNGREALCIVNESRDEQIDLVLSDIVMPEMGGKIMAEWLQATNPEIKILFTSGYTDCGPDGELDHTIEFLPKPYTAAVLARKVREVIDHETPCGAKTVAVAGTS